MATNDHFLLFHIKHIVSNGWSNVQVGQPTANFKSFSHGAKSLSVFLHVNIILLCLSLPMGLLSKYWFLSGETDGDRMAAALIHQRDKKVA